MKPPLPQAPTCVTPHWSRRPEGPLCDHPPAPVTAGAWLAKLAVLLGLGWAALPAWGWAQHRGAAVAGGVAFPVVAHLAVSLNKAIVYRGYAYGTL